jgi:hypothetical protein
MTRLLALIALVGFIVSVVSFGAAVALGGNAIRHGWAPPNGWNMHVRDRGDDDFDITFGDDDDDDRDAGERTTREMTWDGSDHLALGVSAELRYTQADGPPHLTISGPREVVQHVQISNGRIHYDDPHTYWSRRLTITMSAPNVSRFDVNGSDRLIIENYRQDNLTIDSSGATDIQVRGQARTVSLDMSGSSDADLGQLRSEDANVDLSGSAEAIIAPTRSAIIDISGSGKVTLMTRPPTLRTDVSGSGRVITGDGVETAAPATNAAPAQPATPAAPAAPAAPARK